MKICYHIIKASIFNYILKGNIGAWKVKVGDKICPGDILCSIETDKATVDFEM